MKIENAPAVQGGLKMPTLGEEQQPTLQYEKPSPTEKVLEVTEVIAT
jgi:hypothetical protein